MAEFIPGTGYGVLRDRRAIVTRHTQGTLIQVVGSGPDGLPIFEPIARGDYLDILDQAEHLNAGRTSIHSDTGDERG